MRWEIVKVHFEGDQKKYRVMSFDEANVVRYERLFDTMFDAQEYRLKKENESNESVWLLKYNQYI